MSGVTRSSLRGASSRSGSASSARAGIIKGGGIIDAEKARELQENQTAEFFDMPRGGTNYYLISFQLVQLRDAAGGPDEGAGVIVWEGDYEVKFQ